MSNKATRSINCDIIFDGSRESGWRCELGLRRENAMRAKRKMRAACKIEETQDSVPQSE